MEPMTKSPKQSNKANAPRGRKDAGMESLNCAREYTGMGPLTCEQRWIIHKAIEDFILRRFNCCVVPENLPEDLIIWLWKKYNFQPEF